MSSFKSLISLLAASLLHSTLLPTPTSSLPSSCPTLSYSPSILRTSPTTITLRLSNLSPPSADTSVDWLDVHYQVNDGVQMNQRLISPDPVATDGLSNLNAFNSQTKQVDTPLIPMRDSDVITFSYTYHVKGTEIACTTPTFQAKASQIRGEQAVAGENSSSSRSPEQTSAGQQSTTRLPTTSVNSTPSAAPSTTTAPLQSGQGSAVNIQPTTQQTQPSQQQIQQSPQLTVTSGVCPNLRYSVKLNRKQGDGQSAAFSVLFVNDDSKLLDYVDMHYKINHQLYTNFKLGSDVNQTDVVKNPSFELQPQDRLRFFLTYKVQDVEYACDSNFVDMVAKSIGKQMNVETTVTQKEQHVREAGNRDANQGRNAQT